MACTWLPQGGSTQEAFAARGYSFSSGNMFKNGSRVNSGAMPEMSSLEKVEVLKGSAAILYGNVAPGGILNMVTKKPKFKFGGEVSMRMGSYDLYKPAFDVYGPLSKSIAYRVNGTYESAGSYRDYVSSDRYYVNPSLLFKLGKRTELVVEGDYLYHKFTPDFGVGSIDDNKINTAAGRSTFYGTPWQYAKTQQSTATARIKHELNDNWQLTGNVSFQDYNRDYYSTERIQAAANGDWTRPLNRTTTNEKYYAANVDLIGNFKTGRIEHKLLAGVDADRYFTENDAYNQPKTYDKINIIDPAKFEPRTDIPPADKVSRTSAPTNRMGIYVQDLVSLTAKLKLLAGVRFSTQEAMSVDSFYYATGNTVNGTTTKKDKAFSPRLGLVYKPWTTTSFFASYSNSFTVNSGTDIYGQPLDPSIIDQYEVGVKNDFYNGRLSLNVTGYSIINHNLAQTAPFDKDGNPNNNTALKQLVGETTSKGVEVDIAAQPVKGLNIMAGYSFNDMRYTETPESVGNYLEDKRLVNTPAHTANSSVFYTFCNRIFNGLKVGASVYYTGKRYGGWNDAWIAGTDGKPVEPTKTRLIPVDAFTTLDLSVGYSYKKFNVIAKVSNVTNTFNYYVHENYSINPIPPTQLIATVAYRF
jgi:iron complex outermembrane receptor protein